ncbi:2-succinyl-6-hydroxy-2,4-cyclohexadiene-1-carboxylate synthase [Stella humosa]|uniref:2-succinyl-6-hydroxy-2, 4-cyclohexadiene-1-carboxylate synthase n=1 Tax=Stella humosa TaxID=94 RepID=A0A3N1LJX8_9PROT|nr:alpha/beta hydrolase [Stella humosa]ROP91178.1 2-succinyl-6-hydroxy-2,4-cyclohexadiene-1-carboxylate synthase [Stella humosa]BBK34470.1 alpha/beta hydrolase [Stella humosa]
MPHATMSDGVKLFYEETGRGFPILFIHEFAGDHSSWEPQVRAMSRQYRCITYNARGYPPSDVPEDTGRYSQDRAVADAHDLLHALGIAQAHIVGLSMGGFCTVHFGMRHPGLARSLVVAGCGHGAEIERQPQFRADANATADKLLALGMAEGARGYALSPTRVQYQNKDARGWQEFAHNLAGHSAIGSANTLKGVQAGRPSIYEFEADLRQLTVPTLIATGDEDEPTLLPGVFLKRCIPTSGLWIAPKTGHAINLEEPDLFNQAVLRFFHQVESGTWGARDPRSLSARMTADER